MYTGYNLQKARDSQHGDAPVRPCNRMMVCCSSLTCIISEPSMSSSRYHKDRPSFDELPDDLVLAVGHELFSSTRSTAVVSLSAWSALASTNRQMRDTVSPSFRERLDLYWRRLDVPMRADGTWIYLPPTLSWTADRLSSSVNVIGSSGFEPKTLLFWHKKRLLPAECSFACQLLMTSPAFHAIHLSHNPMGDEGLDALLPAIARQLTTDPAAGPQRAPLHWSTMDEARVRDRLATLRLESCDISDDGACALARLLVHTAAASTSKGHTPLSLTELSLCGNRIGEVGREALDAARRKWPGLLVKL